MNNENGEEKEEEDPFNFDHFFSSQRTCSVKCELGSKLGLVLNIYVDVRGKS